MRTFRAIVLSVPLGIGVAALTGGCESMSKATDGAGRVDMLTREWNLESIEGRRLSALYPEQERAPSLRVDPDGRVSGFSGVNRMAGSLDLDSLATGDFVLPPMATTRMAGPEQAMDLESRYLRLLGEARRFEVSSDSLRLTDGDRELLRFVPAE